MTTTADQAYLLAVLVAEGAVAHPTTALEQEQTVLAAAAVAVATAAAIVEVLELLLSLTRLDDEMKRIARMENDVVINIEVADDEWIAANRDQPIVTVTEETGEPYIGLRLVDGVFEEPAEDPYLPGQTEFERLVDEVFGAE